MYLVRDMRGTASELGLRDLAIPTLALFISTLKPITAKINNVFDEKNRFLRKTNFNQKNRFHRFLVTKHSTAVAYWKVLL